MSETTVTPGNPLTAELRIDGGRRFIYEAVPVKERHLEWQKRGLSFTASGYGARIPTAYMVQVGNRWRRVYCRIYSNIGTLYIGKSPTLGMLVHIERG